MRETSTQTHFIRNHHKEKKVGERRRKKKEEKKRKKGSFSCGLFLWCSGRGPGYGSCPSLCVRETESPTWRRKGSDCTPLSPLQLHTDTFTQTYTQQQRRQQQLNMSTAQPRLPRSRWRHRQSDSSEICPVIRSDGGNDGA